MFAMSLPPMVTTWTKGHINIYYSWMHFSSAHLSCPVSTNTINSMYCVDIEVDILRYVQNTKVGSNCFLFH